MRILMFIFAMLALFASSANAGLVKKSNSGICHDQYSEYFERTKNFTEYGSLAACLETGGRLPRNYSGPGPKQGTSALEATEEAKRKGVSYVAVYDRDDYEHWIDRDGDCQNERHELLIETSTKQVTFTDDKQCNVDTGRWYDPYTDKAYHDAEELHIDHIVSLSYAHKHGAHAWSDHRKMVFANDTENLLVVYAGANQSKSDRGPSAWLPPNKQYRCAFLKKYDAVMAKYDLDYFPKENRVIERMRTACGY